jgi:ketosteroid isomerase-like protein
MSTKKETVEAFLEGIAQRDTDAIARLIREDAVWWVPVSGAKLGIDRPLIGRDAVVGLLGGTSGFFRPDTTTWTVLGLFEEDQTVVAHVQRRCLTGSGNPYDNEYLLRFDFVDGSVATVWEHTDTAYAQETILAESRGQS